MRAYKQAKAAKNIASIPTKFCSKM